MTDYTPLLGHMKQIGITPRLEIVAGEKCIVVPVHELIAAELSFVTDLAAQRTGKPIDAVRKMVMEKLSEKIKDTDAGTAVTQIRGPQHVRRTTDNE